MLKINKVENNEVKELLKKYEKKDKNTSIIPGIIVIILLILGAFYLMPSILGMLLNLFSLGSALLIFGVILFLILGNFILDMLLGILNIFR